jgi:hypothetical protein
LTACLGAWTTKSGPRFWDQQPDGRIAGSVAVDDEDDEETEAKGRSGT